MSIPNEFTRRGRNPSVTPRSKEQEAGINMSATTPTAPASSAVTVVISHATSRLTITADTTLAGGRRLTSDEMSHFRAMVTAIADRPELDRPEFIQQGSTEFDFTGGNVPTTKEGVLALFSSLSKSPCPSTGLQFALTDENIVVLD